ncbi:MAG: chemotaxis protein CheX [Syntrophomonas sp.]
MSMSADQIYSEIEKKFKAGFLSKTVIDVIQNIASRDVIEVRSDESEKQVCQSYVSSLMFMTGPVNMVLIISMPMEEAYNIVFYLSGVEVSQLKEENMADVVNEINNMVSGRIKALMNQMGFIYATSHAFTIYGEEYNIFHRSKLKSIIKKFKAGTLELNLRILFI